MKRTFLSSLLIVSLVIIFSCGKDTCNGDTTFRSITLDSVQFNAHKQYIVYFSIQTKDELPLDYLKNKTIINSLIDPYGQKWDNSFIELDSVSFSQPSSSSLKNMILFLKKDSSFLGDTKEIYLHFYFPDRIGYLDCKHPGGPDKYELDMSFTISNSSSGIIHASSFKWNEKLWRGGY